MLSSVDHSTVFFQQTCLFPVDLPSIAVPISWLADWQKGYQQQFHLCVWVFMELKNTKHSMNLASQMWRSVAFGQNKQFKDFNFIYKKLWALYYITFLTFNSSMDGMIYLFLAEIAKSKANALHNRAITDVFGHRVAVETSYKHNADISLMMLMC